MRDAHCVEHESRRMLLARDEVHVWKVAADCRSSRDEWLVLSPLERDRAFALRSPTDRDRWVQAHAALRDVLHLYLDHDPQPQFRRGKYGKPALEEASGVRFNLAHSGQWALIAVAWREVGADVEEIRAFDVDAIAQTVLSANEQLRIGAATGQQRLCEFYRAWTRKEALLKGLGLGLYTDLTEFDVLLDTPPQVSTVVRSSIAKDAPWILADIDVDVRHRAAVAVHGEAAVTIRVLDWRTTRLSLRPSFSGKSPTINPN